ncbi:hypothetical protein ACFY03_24025 [Micromonospora chersina]|uniref:hypothetical protein n=1 Tax=Micromonospora chersina TaxID=47854 RepID=UPI0036CFB113
MADEGQEAEGQTPRSPLLANAYDFVEHSLDEAMSASDEPQRWKFAIIDIATSVELFLKERLRREHPLLIYSKVDEGNGHTITIDAALKRLRACNVVIDQEGTRRLSNARDIRNSAVHFSTQATVEQLRAAYVDLFEFAHSFHQRELGSELHDEIGEAFWDIEAFFMEQFRQEYVQYHGDLVHREWPSVLIDAQLHTHWIIEGLAYRRIPYGDVREGWTEAPTQTCHDCAVRPGQLHGYDCDNERCPRCGGQTLLGCCSDERELGTRDQGLAMELAGKSGDDPAILQAADQLSGESRTRGPTPRKELGAGLRGSEQEVIQ